MERPPGAPVPEARPPEGVRVRPARPRDARGIVTLLREVTAEGRFLRTQELDRDRARGLRRGLRRSWNGQEASLVAVADTDVVGHLHVAREAGPATRHVATLGMAVARDWRGRGVGSALLAEAFRWARWSGVEKLALAVYPGNEPAHALYRKFGFQEEGRLRGHSKKAHGYEDEIVMGRWL